LENDFEGGKKGNYRLQKIFSGCGKGGWELLLGINEFETPDGCVLKPVADVALLNSGQGSTSVRRGER
jgi:hypothetical protein